MSESEPNGRGGLSRLAAGLFSHEPAKEDYSLRYAPPEFRRWAPWKVYVTAIGALAAMAGYTLGADYAIQWGFTNALLGTLLSDVLIILTALPVAIYIARN